MINMIDTTPVFMEIAKPDGEISREEMEAYHSRNPEIFNSYFPNHCPPTDERLNAALEKYPNQYEEMKKVIALLPEVLENVAEKMAQTLHRNYDVECRLLVGTFGSNAYVDHHTCVHFAVEKLSSNQEHLTVLAAHELAHSYHFKMLNEQNFDWAKLSWDGFTSLYLEGVATFVSEQVVPGMDEAVYLSFDNEGDPWIDFYRENRADILCAFYDDLLNWTMEEEREWFRLRGGSRFGFNRLGYLIGWDFISDQSESIDRIMTLWVEKDIRPIITEWLEQQLSMVW